MKTMMEVKVGFGKRTVEGGGGGGVCFVLIFPLTPQTPMGEHTAPTPLKHFTYPRSKICDGHTVHVYECPSDLAY